MSAIPRDPSLQPVDDLGLGADMNQGWLTIGLLAVAGAAGAALWKKQPIYGTIAGMLAVAALRKPLNWS